MKSWKKPTNEMIDRTLKLVKKGTGRRYFFSRLKNPLWIQPLVERGYFQSPPNIRYFDDGYVQFPSWPQLQYLKNVSRDVPDEAINLILELPKVNNPSVYNEILEIALQLHGERSARLKPKILEYADLDYQSLPHRYADLLVHWTAENQTPAALDLTKMLVEFLPDPQSKAKQKRRRENPTDPDTLWKTSLEPSPRINHLEYDEIMSKGVRPLAEKEPYQVAHLLIEATANMIHLRTRWDDMDQGEDDSEIWCKQLCESNSSYEDSKVTLVHTLTFTCERVYEKSPDSIVALDGGLRNQQWKVFKRLRQHLYAQYPNEQTKPWIQELILEHESYHLREYHYEFQRMIRSACEHFGGTLLSKAERTQIFDTILNGGPSRADCQKLLGDKFTEEGFEQSKRDFHRKQFKPFEPLLFGKYVTYFRELQDKTTNPISDEDYQPLKTQVGYVSNRSPRLPEDLAALTDEELLSYINEWEEKEPPYKDDPFVRINIKALAEAFQSVFEKTIIPDANRLRFWIENRERIERPIYVRMMINGMQAEIKDKNFDRLAEWLAFGEWVLSHPDQDEDYRLSEESQENPNWHSSRRAVNDFIEVCLKEEVDVPIATRGPLAQLLEMLCTQFDSWLDRGKRVLLNRNDPLSEGINNTRSLALHVLVDFGLWLRRHDSGAEAPEVKMILEKRFALQSQYPLTLPEYAILGRSYPWIFHLNKAWAAEHKSDFFPQDKSPEWLAAFGSLVCYSDPFKPTFEILRDDFDFALQHLADFKKQDSPGKEPVDILGQHLFHYYLWGLYPLRGSVGSNDSCTLLEQFYQRTDGNRGHWASLFNYVGRILRNTGNQLDKDLKDRTIAFFEWRFAVQEPMELQQFTFWLKAKCLDAEWRLEAYSKILDVCKVEGVSIAMQVETLCELLPDHTTKVLECFVKLTDGSGDDNIYIRTEEAKTILKAGLSSGDESVRQNAERAHDNLLRKSRFDLLDLGD